MSFKVKTSGFNPVVWNALFWIILLFSAINAIAKSFVGENQARNLYYYTLVPAQAVILSKIVYNALLMGVLAFISYLFYSLVMGNPVQDQSLFIFNMFLGAFGFASTLSLIAGIASKSNNNGTMMAILSFPILIPMLVLIIKISKNAVDGLERANVVDELLTVGAINVIVITLSYLLFPYLWRS